LHADNIASLTALGPDEMIEANPIAALLIDPQTAGGLLAGVPADRATACVAQLHRLDYRAAEIGRVEQATGSSPRVRLARSITESLPETVIAS
jgi:selenide,water dikinase